MEEKFIEAVNALAVMKRGDAVAVTQDGRTHTVRVARPLHRDHLFGSFKSSRITVTFGRGQYLAVTAEQLAIGSASIKRTDA